MGVVNVNYVYGMSDDAAQTWMPPLAWFAMLLVAIPMVLYLPTHLAPSYFFAPKAADGRARGANHV